MVSQQSRVSNQQPALSIRPIMGDNYPVGANDEDCWLNAEY